jgi:hypothetical protein
MSLPIFAAPTLTDGSGQVKTIIVKKAPPLLGYNGVSRRRQTPADLRDAVI